MPKIMSQSLCKRGAVREGQEKAIQKGLLEAQHTTERDENDSGN